MQLFVCAFFASGLFRFSDFIIYICYYQLLLLVYLFIFSSLSLSLVCSRRVHIPSANLNYHQIHRQITKWRRNEANSFWIVFVCLTIKFSRYTMITCFGGCFSLPFFVVVVVHLIRLTLKIVTHKWEWFRYVNRGRTK